MVQTLLICPALAGGGAPPKEEAPKIVIDGLEDTEITLDILRDMPLTTLFINETLVTDLSPLKGMQLEQLNLHRTKVQAPSPLKGMPLGALHLVETEVTDLSPSNEAKLTRTARIEVPSRSAAAFGRLLACGSVAVLVLLRVRQRTHFCSALLP